MEQHRNHLNRPRTRARLPRFLQGVAGTAVVIAYLWLAAPPPGVF
ncbi:hypothetical protein [Sandarakinorhabdus sp.]|nr:hypothetical protein [Sandarakinorhabdus sp.]